MEVMLVPGGLDTLSLTPPCEVRLPPERPLPTVRPVAKLSKLPTGLGF
jgi:hypothetical protein